MFSSLHQLTFLSIHKYTLVKFLLHIGGTHQYTNLGIMYGENNGN